VTGFDTDRDARNEADGGAPDERSRDEPRPLPAVHTWLIDGFNVLHAVLLGGESRSGWWKREQRERLLARLERFSGDAEALVVVFDGDRDPPDGENASGGRVRVMFRPSADDWIVTTVRAGEIAGPVGVVTNDRQVAGRCRHAGAAVIGPRDLMAHCPAESAEPSP
jgi:predicted RNA-binding protein with PIN domain